MANARIRNEDIAGIGIAVLAHVLLLAVLVLRPMPKPPAPVQKVTVTLQGPVAAEAGSPSREEAATASAPKLAEEPAPPEAASPAPVPQRIQPAPRPAPAPLPAPRVQPRVPAPQAKPAPPQAKPASPRPSRITDNFLPPQPKGKANAKPGGGSRIGADFLPGALSGSGKAAVPPGPTITAQVKASLAMAVSRELKPHWQAPQGLEVEKLATTIEWNLNPDGTLDGAPRFISQAGVSQANRAQADRHREQAVRAIRLAAPFALPPQFYAGWRHVRFTFDRKLD